MEQYKMVCEYLDEHFPDIKTADLVNLNIPIDVVMIEVDLYNIKKWLEQKWKVIVSVIPSVDKHQPY